MKITSKITRLFFVLGFILSIIPNANAQLLKKLQKKAEEAVERKLEQKVEKETEKTMDTILNPNEKSSTKKTPQTNPTNKTIPQTDNESVDIVENTNVSDNLEIYSKYDFVPGDDILFFDDFSQDFIGDFPSKWNTNASGEVVKMNNIEGNWFEFKPGYGIYYIPDLKNLPEDYTIEFDLLTSGLTRNTSSSARMDIVLSDTNTFNNGSKHYVETSIPLGQYSTFDILLSNYFNSNYAGINSSVSADIRDEVLNQPHIAISVTKNRYRLWVNETKYVDIPRMITELNALNYIKFHVDALKDGEERVFIRNLKVAKGGQDLRRELLSNGKVSTNGILFDSGSANIQPQSYGIIRQISQVLQQDASIKLNILGHTDSDGNDDVNLKLSKARAEAVKNALVKVYSISSERLQTDGKGEISPIGDNTTMDGKAKNRRVEFIKI
jgi:OmpA-OmpF porin, OOP family